MAKVAIFDDTLQKWIEYDEDTEVLIQYLPKEAAKELSAKVDKIVNRTGSPWAQVWEQKIAEAAVKGWRQMGNHSHPGFVLPDGSPIPFTPENRDMMMKRCREFSTFVTDNAIDAKIFMEISTKPAEAAEIKND